jgi:hypothetical protein
MFVQANAAQKKKRARAATGVLESSGVLYSDAVMIWSGSSVDFEVPGLVR